MKSYSRLFISRHLSFKNTGDGHEMSHDNANIYDNTRTRANVVLAKIKNGLVYESRLQKPFILYWWQVSKGSTSSNVFYKARIQDMETEA